MGKWKDILTAPLDGTVIQARIPGHGDDNMIMWLSGCVEDESGPCGSWVFASEYQEPPDDWCDGYCWAVNSSGVRSTWPTHWMLATPAKDTPDDQ